MSVTVGVEEEGVGFIGRWLDGTELKAAPAPPRSNQAWRRGPRELDFRTKGGGKLLVQVLDPAGSKLGCLSKVEMA